MPNAFQAAGSAGRKQTAAAPIFVNEFFTGLITQGNPLRDRATAHLIEKFYQGNRYDSLIDGLNMEISNRTTLKRRCGSSVYNSAIFPPINRFFEFRQVLENTENIIVVADTATAIYNATGPSTKTLIFTKSGNAVQTSFESVGNTMYFGDGVDQKKWMQPGPWEAETSLATTSLAIGDAIIDSNGNLEYLNAFQVGTITNVALATNVVTLTFSNTNFTLQTGMSFTPAGLSGGSFLNGKRLIATGVVASGSTFLVTAYYFHPAYAAAADSGTATTTDVGTPATTGASAPSWAGSVGGTTADGFSTWTNFGTPVYDWGAPIAPVQAPTIAAVAPGIGDMSFWQPGQVYGGALIVDQAGNIQQGFSSVVGGISQTTGPVLPSFSQVPIFGSLLTGASSIKDAGVTWYCCGTIRNLWQASQAIPAGGLGGYVVVDANGNVQQCTIAGTTGGSQPTWNTTLLGTTTDGGVTWTMLGPCLALAFQGWKYGYCYHCVDGSLSTMSPFTPSTNGVIDGVLVKGVGSANAQVDSVWVFRTTDGGPLPLFLTSIPNPGAAAWSYVDQNPDSSLNEFIEAPTADAGNPPAVGATALTYHLGRLFYAVGNTMFWTAGPDSAFNGNTASPPLNNYVLPSLIKRYVPLTIGLLIFTTSGAYFSGIGGANNDVPLAPRPWMQGKVGGILSYNALDVVGSTIYLFNSKKMCKAIDISSGESEVGFPVGDVMAGKATAGGESNMNPAAVYVNYHEQDSTDTALYVSYPSYLIAVSPRVISDSWWLRLNPTPAPESGATWSPPAVSAAATYSAVQSVETSPGIHQLLLGPGIQPSGPNQGPILFRDPTTFEDNGTVYPCYADIGALVLAFGGQAALIYFITTDCPAVGSRPEISVLMQEIGGHAEMLILGESLSIATADPPQLGPAEAVTVYNDRWWFSASQKPAYCRYMTIEFAWPAENEPAELLSYTLFGEHYQEV